MLKRLKEPLRMLLALLFVLTTGVASADQAVVEAEARRIEAELIAPCCWSQQVSVHQSPAADEIRKDVRLRLARGQTRQQILDDYVVQFGTRILAEPPAKGFTSLLYVLPPVLLVVGAGLVVVLVRRFSSRAAPAAPTAAAPADGAPSATRTPDRAYDDRLEDELANLD
jgi:cytochrome c-type biogenesis protein CcmH